MEIKNLWGELPEQTDLVTPASILKAQADYLTQASRGLLKGMVETSAEDKSVLSTLIIVVPALNRYKYELLYVVHPISLYPARMTVIPGKYTVECVDQDEFQTKLGEALSHTETRKVLAALRSQAQT